MSAQPHSVAWIDATTMEVDDTHPWVFATGNWKQQQIIGLFNNTVSYTSEQGSTKILRFVGTSITVNGGLQQYTDLDHKPPLTSYSIDGGPTTTYSAPSPPLYTAVVYYQSPKLPMGEHILTMKNTVDHNIVHLDSFTISSPTGTTPEILQSDGSQIPNIVSSSPINSNAASTPDSLLTTQTPLKNLPTPFNTSVILRTTASGSKDAVLTRNLASTDITPSSTSITQHLSPTSVGMPTHTSTDDATPPHHPLPEGSHVNLTAIIAGAVAAVIAVILAAIMMILLLKRKRKMELVKEREQTVRTPSFWSSRPPTTMSWQKVERSNSESKESLPPIFTPRAISDDDPLSYVSEYLSGTGMPLDTFSRI